MGVLYPSGGKLPGILETDIDQFLKEYRKDAPVVMQLGLTLSSLIFILSPIFTVLVPLPVFLLPPSLKDKHANRLANSRFYLVRQTILLLRLVAGLCWGKDNAVRAAMGMKPLNADPGTFRGSK